jgi:hypothetical protein
MEEPQSQAGEVALVGLVATGATKVGGRARRFSTDLALKAESRPGPLAAATGLPRCGLLLVVTRGFLNDSALFVWFTGCINHAIGDVLTE